MDNHRQRSKNSIKVLGNKQPRETGPKGVKEGEHYDCLAYSDFLDMFIPTMVVWFIDGQEVTDNFEDLEKSKELRDKAVSS